MNIVSGKLTLDGIFRYGIFVFLIQTTLVKLNIHQCGTRHLFSGTDNVGDSSHMVQEQVRQTHMELMEVHEEVRSEFTQLRRATLRQYLGDLDSPEFRSQLLEHGDGYTLRSVPVHIDDMLDADQIVLIVMNYPLLAEDSVFDPHVHMVGIPYWRDDKGLRREVRSEDGHSRTFHFMIWEQDSPMHGECDRRARFNQRLVSRRSERLRNLITEQERASERFVTACRDWLGTQGRRLAVLVNARRHDFPPYIDRLLMDNSVVLIRTNLTGVNRRIMERLSTAT